MKKFLAFLLIAIIACTAVEDLELEGLWDKFKNWCKKNWSKIKGTFITIATNIGKASIIALCQKWGIKCI